MDTNGRVERVRRLTLAVTVSAIVLLLTLGAHPLTAFVSVGALIGAFLFAVERGLALERSARAQLPHADR